MVVTGLGAVSPVGNDVDSCWRNLLAGKSGIGPVTRFDASDFRCRIAGEIKGLEKRSNTEAKVRPVCGAGADSLCLRACTNQDCY